MKLPPGSEHGTDTVLAVHSSGTNINRAGVSYASRIDLADVLARIRSFLQR
jgi:hypothetical protein